MWVLIRPFKWDNKKCETHPLLPGSDKQVAGETRATRRSFLPPALRDLLSVSTHVTTALPCAVLDKHAPTDSDRPHVRGQGRYWSVDVVVRGTASSVVFGNFA